ncbi:MULTISPECIES: 2,3-diaminopropionate biosynthesis protein SbnB [Prauserella salsuginis group]|uniref:2,3-diaminopropionate biosynthesis protein SbnB n=1 Tax=Prauserella salsuginis TaxID=387889 RepID=A0ABW6G065_9PSEU|nr:MULTISPECIES: 2,3-diaminopropionate biosynthesis protein SbnB [Prauserella salsuginis group]
MADDILRTSRTTVLELVHETYLLHEAGASINPDSYFLRFPDKPNSRVIALPGYLGGTFDKIGMKWIASFPDNVASGRPRASAALLLNDYATGSPIACLESAGISAARTAASATLAAARLKPAETRTVSFIGSGIIARTIADYLLVAVQGISEAVVHDLVPASGANLVRYISEEYPITAKFVDTLNEALESDIVVFATTAPTPYVTPATEFHPGQLVLNISLRDIAPEILLRSNNVLDDVDHCLKAETSAHLAERLSDGREFIDGTIGDVLRGEIELRSDRATIFSPFGLGVLDIAVGSFVLKQARDAGKAVEIENFIGEEKRW